MPRTAQAWPFIFVVPVPFRCQIPAMALRHDAAHGGTFGKGRRDTRRRRGTWPAGQETSGAGYDRFTVQRSAGGRFEADGNVSRGRGAGGLRAAYGNRTSDSFAFYSTAGETTVAGVFGMKKRILEPVSFRFSTVLGRDSAGEGRGRLFRNLVQGHQSPCS